MSRLAWFVIGQAALILALLWLAFIGRAQRLPGDVLGWDVGACSVSWYSRETTVTLACMGRDQVRLWPWPVTKPWFENQGNLTTPTPDARRPVCCGRPTASVGLGRGFPISRE
jgi:hypothetical protein